MYGQKTIRSRIDGLLFSARGGGGVRVKMS